MEKNSPESYDARFWDIVGGADMPAYDDREFEKTEQHLRFEAATSTVESLAAIMQQGNTCAEAVNKLLGIGVAIEDLLNKGAFVGAVDIADGRNVPLSETHVPSLYYDDGMVEIAVPALPKYRIAIPLFCEQHNCTSDVAINALIQRGDLLYSLMQRGVMLRIVQGDTIDYLGLDEFDEDAA